jgi:penicillin-binding protein 1B
MPLVEKRIKKPSKDPLQVAALTVDLDSAQVLALVGGRDFRETQFNRASDGHRQIGSTVKPFVYLPAMGPHDPLSIVEDAPFEWKSGKQVWKPKNYDGESFGPVPYFFALAESLNVAAAKVGQEVGLDNVAQTLRDAGVRATVPNLPSLTLGAIELSPFEVAQAYTTLARMGAGDQIHTLSRVEDLNGHVLFARTKSDDYKLPTVPAAEVIGMLEQSFTVGTARSARAAGIQGAVAGKTGTTSDTKDAWFAGFTPHFLTVVWVGYDDNTVMGLTGAGAALPVWIHVHRGLARIQAEDGFKWPEGVRLRTFSKDELSDKFPNIKVWPESLELVLPDNFAD